MLDFLLLFSIVACLLCCPYTKVEESFNMQAISDLHAFNFNVDKFDHLEFPGVVPRTFVGAIVVYAISLPMAIISSIAAVPERNLQIISRFSLGLLSWYAFLHFKSGVRSKFGKRASDLCVVLMSLQFHLCFYMSRTLPNTFALVFTLFAFGQWLKGSALVAICIIASGMVIFRCDLLILLGPMTLQLLLAQEVTFLRGLVCGVLTCLLSLAITVSVDSVAWKQWVWPEGIVLFYNTVENKSSDWGVSPFHWYFTNALPKSLNMSLLWIFCGLAGIQYPNLQPKKTAKSDDKPAQAAHSDVSFISAVLSMFTGVNYKLCYYVMPAVLFVALYSILPHKELRFLFPVMPLFVLAGAVGLDLLLPSESKQLWYPFNMLSNGLGKSGKESGSSKALKRIHILLSAGLMVITLISVFLLSTFLTASFHNYPGGVALERLLDQHLPTQQFVTQEKVASAVAKGQFESLKEIIRPVFVHIDVLAATSGVTRFLQDDVKLFDKTVPIRADHPDLGNNYLSTLPSQFNYTSFYQQDCFRYSDLESPSEVLQHQVLKQCARISVVYYSKDENVVDYSTYDWLINEIYLSKERSNSTLWNSANQFVLAEEVKGFHRMKFSVQKSLLPVQTTVELKTMLYIYHNSRKPL